MCAMVFSGRNYETMPQTVPSAGFTPPCDYNSFAADSFDLSLLPYCDSEVPYSPFNLLYYDLTGSPPPMFPAPQQTSDPKKPQPQQPLQVKEEPYSSYLVPPAPTGLYPAPPPASPAGSTTSSTYTNNSSPYQQCPSPPSSRLLPAIKHEQTIDLQEILQESRFLQETVSEQTEKKPDHQLLREVLKDTSFQRKYNIRPLDLEGLSAAAASTSSTCDERVKTEPTIAPSCSGSSKQETGDGSAGSSSGGGAGLVDKIEPVLSMAIEQLRMDVNNTCSVLGISSDLSQWTVDDVKAWLLWTLRQYNLPMIQMEYFNMDGVALSALTEEEFQKRAPECGSTLYAQLEIWKAACSELDSQMDISGILQWNSSNNSSSSSGDLSEEEEEEEPETAATSGGKAPSSRSSGGGGGGGGGSHIHLWQFLKELLSAPQLHGSCIRWLDRSKGVFKIEDSVRVARLWGKRKNRPAMNYDKLSRSIRQYYKKGIMKKTERSQRLVYQFCHPYCL